MYKIQNSHTIHMVKGVSRSAGTSSQPAAPPPLPTMQTGLNPSDPLTQLNGHRGFGAMAGFNPFSQMGLNTNDPNMVRRTAIINRLSLISARARNADAGNASEPRFFATNVRHYVRPGHCRAAHRL